MFLFSRNRAAAEKKNAAPAKVKKEVKKDIQINEYLSKIKNEQGQYKAVYIYMHKLNENSLRSTSRQVLIEMFENVTRKFGGEIFGLPNDDIIIFYNIRAEEEILACLIKVRYMFHDDPLLKDVIDLEQAGFIRYYELKTEQEELQLVIKEAMKNAAFQTEVNNKETTSRSKGEWKYFNPGVRKLRRELTPGMLGKVQKVLAMTDFSSLIRRQSVCAVIGKSSPQVLFDEVFVSIADLRDMLLPDVDLTANPWLFLALAGTLDKRVLVHVSRHDDGALTSNFSLNLNVSTILSDEFLEFDNNINTTMRSSIVLEVQLVDIFSDIKAFLLAKTFAQYRGYKICIDGITVDKLQYINRSSLGADLIKIIWHPSFIDVVNEDKHFMDYVNRAERAKMILCRVDDPKAVDVGNSLGINLYQGRYIQQLLANQPKKTLFSIR